MELNAITLWLFSTFEKFDMNLALFFHKLYDFAGWFFTPFFEFVSFLGYYGIILVTLSIALMFFRKTRKYGTAMLLGAAIGALFTNCVLKILIARPRPFSDQAAELLGTRLYYDLWLTVGQNIEVDGSFPSGHTTFAFATMIPVFLLGNKKYSWAALIFSFVTAVARTYLMVHFASDVLGGIIVGTISGILGTMIALKLPASYYRYEFRKRKKKAGGKHCSV